MTSSKLRGTFLVELKNGKQFVFGNNYKPWWQHATEFIYRNFGSKEFGWRYQDVADVVKSVSYSNQQFYDDGGLKWCNLESYQEVIDEVCKRDGLAPVSFDLVVFADAPIYKTVLTKKLKEY